MANRWSLHVEAWQNCRKCELHQTRQRIVLARGAIPCDVLFVGEAPGESENSNGKPFTGPAGHLLDQIIEKGFSASTATHALTNLVGCIPRADEMGKLEKPDPASIKACAPRLVDLVDFCSPKLIVAVGKLAEDWLDPGHKGGPKFKKLTKQVHITHPSAILQANVVQQGLLMQRCIVTLQDALEDL